VIKNNEKLARAMAIGAELTGFIFGSIILGQVIDRWLGTKGIATFICLMAGFVAFTVKLLRAQKK